MSSTRHHTPVDPRHAFDASSSRLAPHSRSEARGSLDVGAFESGQSNPTYLLTAAGRKLVLRRKPLGTLLSLRRMRSSASFASCGHSPPRRYRFRHCLALCEDPAVNR